MDLPDEVESIRQCQRVWYQAVSHKFSVSVLLCLLAMTLIYFSEWQAGWKVEY